MDWRCGSRVRATTLASGNPCVQTPIPPKRKTNVNTWRCNYQNLKGTNSTQFLQSMKFRQGKRDRKVRGTWRGL
jgi:hypothetical protein